MSASAPCLVLIAAIAELVVFCRPSQLQLSMYQHLLNSPCARSFVAGISSGGGADAIPSALLLIGVFDVIMRRQCLSPLEGWLRKLCNHPEMVYSLVTAANNVGPDDTSAEGQQVSAE